MTAIAIIGAMDEEVAHIAAALDDVAVTDEAGLTITRGTLTTDRGAECDIIATVGGMGMVNIAATTQHLIDVGHPDAVIFSGIAVPPLADQGRSASDAWIYSLYTIRSRM